MRFYCANKAKTKAGFWALATIEVTSTVLATIALYPAHLCARVYERVTGTSLFDSFLDELTNNSKE